MGAFFLWKNSKVHNVAPALALFAEMGFASPTSFEVGEWMLYAYPKMTKAAPDIVSVDGCKLISVGTPVYKGLDHSGSLSALLGDFLSGDIDSEQLIGQYTLLFCRGDHIEILCDPLGSKHLFTDKDHCMLSSHMLSICQCFAGDLHINKKAVYEKLLTGIIMPPNTMFEEIIQIDKQIAGRVTQNGVRIEFISPSDLRFPGSGTKALKTILAEQADTLRQYFESLSNVSKDGIDIGLSGGYDSRLALACLNKYCKGKIHLHSHATENVHQKDLSIAKQLAEYVGLPCNTVPTKKLFHCDDVDVILRKSILYFDGRSSFSIGGCGQVYTAEYRKASTESATFTMTGVGGELYRNVFDIGFKRVRFDRFMEDRVTSASFRKAMPESLYRETMDDITARAAARLGIDRHSRQPKLIAHRYYCEIMMPDGQGVALDAYNQVSDCIAPFLEPRIIAKGYEAIPFHRSGGEFEGKLISIIDPGLAAIPSSYGHPIDKRPVRAKIKEKLRAYIPTLMWNRLAGIIQGKNAHRVESAKGELYANSQILKEAYTFLIELFPEIDFSYLLHTNEDIRKIQFVATTLYFFKGRVIK